MYASIQPSPIIEFKDALMDQFTWFANNINLDGFPYYAGLKLSEQEQIMKLILENNGCAFDDKATVIINSMESCSDYILAFIWGGKGNSVNEYYDYIEFYGTKYFIIFMDYFINIFNPSKPILGRSVYFDALVNLTDIFISTISVVDRISKLSTSASSNANRFNGVFVAALILDEIIGLEEDDVSMIKYEELREMIDNIPTNLLFLGVKYME